MSVRFNRNLGFQLLGVWLIAAAIIQMVPGILGPIGLLLPPLALIAGLLILIGR
jgi:hypothetical protein